MLIVLYVIYLCSPVCVYIYVRTATRKERTMSVDRYRQSLAGMNLRPNEATWFPKWLAAYASDRQVKLRINPAGDVPVELTNNTTGIWLPAREIREPSMTMSPSRFDGCGRNSECCITQRVPRKPMSARLLREGIGPGSPLHQLGKGEGERIPSRPSGYQSIRPAGVGLIANRGRSFPL